MNKGIKAKWLEALRSGEFEQGTHYLNDDGKLCCLGVLCEIAVREGVVEKDDASGIAKYGTPQEMYDGKSGTAVLPPSVWRWAELEGRDPSVPNGTPNSTYVIRLSTLNDVNGKTFRQIADVIEKHL